VIHGASAHAREQKPGAATSGEVKVQILSDKGSIATATLPVTGIGSETLDAPFHQPLPAGFYKVTAIYSQDGHGRAFYENGFLVAKRDALASGPVLGVKGDFLSLDGKPFFPVGHPLFHHRGERLGLRGAAECLGMGQGFC